MVLIKDIKSLGAELQEVLEIMIELEDYPHAIREANLYESKNKLHSFAILQTIFNRLQDDPEKFKSRFPSHLKVQEILTKRVDYLEKIIDLQNGLLELKE